jgi:hypothetical protein
MQAQFRRWLLAAGAQLRGEVQLEIHPEFALDVEELRRVLPPGLTIEQDRYFAPERS